MAFPLVRDRRTQADRRPAPLADSRALALGMARVTALLISVLALDVFWDLRHPSLPLPLAIVTILLVAAIVTTGMFISVVHVPRLWARGQKAYLAQLEETARRDELSGLYNYRYLQEAVRRELDAARAAARPCAFIMVDLDDFKDANDRFGHIAGDTLIAAIGAALRDEIGDEGIVARYGGDEFTILLPGLDATAARDVAGRAAAAIADASLRATPANAHLRVTASWGIAAFPADAGDPETLIAAADRALYAAKAERVATKERSDERHAQDVFFAIGEVLGDSLDPGERVRNLVHAVAAAMNLDACWIWMARRDGNMAVRSYHVADADVPRRFLEIPRLSREEAAEHGLFEGRPAYGDDAATAAVLPERFRGLLVPGSWIVSVPLQAPTEGILVMSAQHERVAPPAMTLLSAVARLATSAIRNAEVYHRARRQGEQLSALAGVGGLLFGEGDFETRLGEVVRAVAEVTGYENVTLDTEDPTGERPFFRQFHGVSPDGSPMPERMKELWLSLKPALTEKSVADFLATVKDPIVMDDPVNQVPELYREVIIQQDIRSVVVVPLNWQGALKGLFYFASYREHAFDEHAVVLLQTIAAQLAPSLQVASLHVELENSYTELKDAHLQAILRLAYAAEARDPYTGRHLHRITSFSDALARQMGLAGEALEALSYGAVVHDLGKLRIPDSILIKAGELSDDEWRVMKKHPEYGAEFLGKSSFYDIARQVALHHHERWDGSGYPRGLRGEEIPLAARIVSVADVYDALTSDRPYKMAWPPERALAELLQMRGKHLCPKSVDAFLQLWNDGVIARIEAETHGDQPSFEFDFRERYAA